MSNAIYFGDYRAIKGNDNLVYVQAKDGTVATMEMQEFKRFLADNTPKVDKQPSKDYFAPNQEQPKDNPGFFKKIGAGMVGSIVAAPVGLASLPIAVGLQNQMVKVNRSISKDSVKILNKAGEKVLKESGLAPKGVKILRSLPADLKAAMPRGNIFGLPKNISKFLKTLNPIYQAKLGRNAFFRVETNEAIVSNKMALSQFHELGHAMNRHTSKFGKFLQGIRLDVIKQIRQQNAQNIFRGMPLIKIPVAGRILGAIAGTIGLVSVFKNKKATGEKPKGFFDKITTFIKNNVGKLTFLTMLPIVLEEGLASYKGEKFAAKFLKPDLLKKVKLTNRLGLATYLTGAILAGLAARVAVNVRDRIAQPNTK